MRGVPMFGGAGGVVTTGRDAGEREVAVRDLGMHRELLRQRQRLARALSRPVEVAVTKQNVRLEAEQRCAIPVRAALAV